MLYGYRITPLFLHFYVSHSLQLLWIVSIEFLFIFGFCRWRRCRHCCCVYWCSSAYRSKALSIDSKMKIYAWIAQCTLPDWELWYVENTDKENTDFWWWKCTTNNKMTDYKWEFSFTLYFSTLYGLWPLLVYKLNML